MHYEEEIKDIINNPLYLFSWDDIPGKDNEQLLKFLKDDLKIELTENIEIKKSRDNETIIITNKNLEIIIKLNKTEKKVIFEIPGGGTYEYFSKEENGKLNIYKSYIWIKEHMGVLYIVFPTTEKRSRKITCLQYEDKKVVSINGDNNNCQSRSCCYCRVQNKFVHREVSPNHLPKVGDCISLTYHLNYENEGYVKLKYYGDGWDRKLFTFIREPQRCDKGLKDLEVYRDIEFEVIPEQGDIELSYLQIASGIKEWFINKR